MKIHLHEEMKTEDEDSVSRILRLRIRVIDAAASATFFALGDRNSGRKG